MKKTILTILLLANILFATQIVWDGKSQTISHEEYQKAIKEYVDKTYPNKVKTYKKYQYQLLHPTDKYGNVYGIVKSPYTGKIWLDRNLGAKRVCRSFDDEQCYGDYFQWGRDSDGHEKQNSATTSTLSSSDTPNHSKFIKSDGNHNWDWRNPQNDNLWQGVDGINNPCPKGYRVPTIDELLVETINQGVKNRYDAFKSFLKLPSAGYRSSGNGFMYTQGSWGDVWSSAVDGSGSFYLDCNSGNAYKDDVNRAFGQSVRCLKD